MEVSSKSSTGNVNNNDSVIWVGLENPLLFIYPAPSPFLLFLPIVPSEFDFRFMGFIVISLWTDEIVAVPPVCNAHGKKTH